MGKEVAPRQDTPSARQHFDRLLLAEAAGWLRDCVAATDPVQPATGAELEFGLLDARTLRPAHRLGPMVLKELAALFPDAVSPELVRPDCEVLTVPRLLAVGTPFADTAADLRAKINTAQDLAAKYGLVVGLVGFPPTWGSEFAVYRPELLVPMLRYATYVDRMPSLDLEIPGIDGAIHVHADTVVGIGGCLAWQFTLDVPERQLDRYYDAASIWAALQRSLSVNAPFPWGQEALADDVRWDIFQAATTVDGRERAFVGPRWTHSPMDVFDVILRQVRRRTIFLDADASEPGSAYAKFMSCVFPAVRPRFSPAGRIYLEFRVESSGPTIADMVAQAAVTIGAVSYLGRHIDDWRNHVPFSDVQRNFGLAAYGPLTEMTWQDCGITGTLRAIDILSLMIDRIRRELTDTLGVDREDAASALIPAERLIATGQTGADIQRQAYYAARSHGATHERAIYAATAVYLELTEHGTSPTPAADLRVRDLVFT